jgi:hypothetical protein
MCIIVYKPQNKAFPSMETLRTCFNRNPDGAGYMFTKNNQVEIKKGFMTFKEFVKSLKNDKRQNSNAPFVFHFRISTQGGVKRELCHPYPLSDDMEKLKKLRTNTRIGVAHNGIIPLTSDYGYGYGIYDYSRYYSKDKVDVFTPNDTMKFIVDYLSLIIKDEKYFKDEKTLTLIERLCESKLAILNGNGHCELIGDFVESGGCYYSNNTFQPVQYQTTKFNFKSTPKSYLEKFDLNYKDKDIDDDYDKVNDPYGDFYNPYKKKYEFVDCYCPCYNEGDISYCDKCANDSCECNVDYYRKLD